MRILVVEDEKRLADDIATTLNASGFVAETAHDGEDAWFLGDTEDYAAVILDLGLPAMDGITVLKNWRKEGRTMPVLILTARGSWTERVEGINAGADDYLPKPFQMEELIARLRAILRRAAGQASTIIRAGAVSLDVQHMRVAVNSVPLDLSRLEYRALSYLMHHQDRTIPQHELSEHVYGMGSERDSNALEVLIGRLRRKLGVPLIETRRGYGYVIPLVKTKNNKSGERS